MKNLHNHNIRLFGVSLKKSHTHHAYLEDDSMYV